MSSPDDCVAALILLGRRVSEMSAVTLHEVKAPDADRLPAQERLALTARTRTTVAEVMQLMGMYRSSPAVQNTGAVVLDNAQVLLELLTSL